MLEHLLAQLPTSIIFFGLVLDSKQ